LRNECHAESPLWNSRTVELFPRSTLLRVPIVPSLPGVLPIGSVTRSDLPGHGRLSVCCWCRRSAGVECEYFGKPVADSQQGPVFHLRGRLITHYSEHLLWGQLQGLIFGYFQQGIQIEGIQCQPHNHQHTCIR